MLKRQANGVTIKCITGDIANQVDMVAVVNAANAELRIGGGVAGTLHRAAGPGLEAECRPLAPIKPGQAVITSGHHLPNRYVIHCLGPVYGRDEPADELLAACYRNALRLTEEHQISSIAFPAISTGAFGYPLQKAASIAFRTIAAELPALQHVHHIRFVLYDHAALRIHEETLMQVFGATERASR